MDIRTKSIIEALAGQRNAAHDMVAALMGENAALKAEIAELKAQIVALTERFGPASDDRVRPAPTSLNGAPHIE